LKGLPPNTRGIGAKIWLYGGAVPMQSQEMICGGRYLSSDDAMRVFAAGSLTNEMRIEVKWRSGKRSVVNGVLANRIYEIDEARAGEGGASERQSVRALKQNSRVQDSENHAPRSTLHALPLFEDVSVLLQHNHHEDPFDDFARQPLLPNKLSQLGPGVSWFDVDGDGWEDLMIGSGKGGALAVYRNDGQGGFQRLSGFEQAVTRDQSGILGWRGSGGTVILAGSANYEDGLAVGSCVRQYGLSGKELEGSLPGQQSSTGPLALGDLNGDGQMELFVGGRVVPGKYPEAATSLLFRRGQRGWELDEEKTRALAGVGLVSGAVMSDLDGDGYPELILACEWGALKIFRNQRGNLVPWDAPLTINHQPSTINQLSGWWNGVNVGDFDGDGRLDIVAANWGLNSKYRASAEHPRKLYYGELGGQGAVDLVEAYYDEGMRVEVPERDLNAVGAALPWVREKYSTYAAYGQASVAEIYGERLKGLKGLEARQLATMLFLNRGDHFEARELPGEAQFSPGFAVCVGDMDGDGKEDVFLSQNFFAVAPETSRNDAGRGLWLKGDGSGGLSPVPGQESGVKVYGEQRGAALCDYDGDGRVDLVVTQNGAETKLYHNVGAKPGLRVRLQGPAGNPAGIGAQVGLIYGERAGPVREIHAGSGYWSQDSAVQVLGTPQPPTQIWVRWPGGKSTTSALPQGVKEISVDEGGQVKVHH